MRSATSYFNGTLYRKTLARFWPLWAGYGVIWFLMMPLNLLNTYLDTAQRMRDQVVGGSVDHWRLQEALRFPSYVTPGMYLVFFFAIFCAMAVFGYLYNSRSTCWFHALPLRREALFTTQYLAGLSFLLLPQLAAALLTAVIELSFLPMEHWGQALAALGVWLLAMSGICLFFFSFAAFCAMFTGHILALPAFYGILNVLADVIYSLVDSLFCAFFFGYAGSLDAARVAGYLSPVEILREASQWWGTGGERYFSSAPTIAAYAAVGVGLALISLYVYRRRHAETAGDVVSVAVVRPLFKYGVSFCAGLCFGMLTSAFFGWGDATGLIPCVLVWTVVGYFVAEMLLKKSFRVLRAWKGGAVMTAVMLALCLGCVMDLFGVAARVPAADQIEELTVYFDTGYPNDSGNRLSATLTDPESIQKFLELHQAIVDDRDRLDRESIRFYSGNDYSSLRLDYALKGGSSLRRHYNSIPIYREELDQEGSFTNLAQRLIQDRELMAMAYDFEGRLDGCRLTGAWLYCLSRDGEELYDNVYVDDYAQELWDAVQADFAEGTIGVRYLFDSDPERIANTYRTDLSFDLTPLPNLNPDDPVSSSYNYSTSLDITLTPNAKHTLAVLDKTGLWEEGYALAPCETEETGPFEASAVIPQTYQ